MFTGRFDEFSVSATGIHIYVIQQTSPNVTTNATIEEIVALVVWSLIAQHGLKNKNSICFKTTQYFVTKNATITNIEIVALLVTLATIIKLTVYSDHRLLHSTSVSTTNVEKYTDAVVEIERHLVYIIV